MFLRTVAIVRKSFPDAVFTIAGDGPGRGALQDLAAELGIDGAVRFLGWQGDLSDFYATLDVMLFNSDVDALGRTPIAAAALGVPVVASVLKGGLTEVLRSPDEAIILDAHDVERLAVEVVGLIREPERGATMAAAARRRVAECGDVRRHARAMEALLVD